MLKNLTFKISLAILGGCLSLSCMAQLRYSGSDTLEPLVVAANLAYQRSHPGFKLSMNATGSSVGLRELCSGKTLLAGSSRLITPAEVKECERKGVVYSELTAAADALVLIVSTKNPLLKELRLTEIKSIFEPAASGKLMSWKQVRPSFADLPLVTAGVGIKHGTFSFFHNAIGNAGFARSDMKDMVEHSDTVKFVAANPGAVGYVPLSVAKDFSAQVVALKVDFGSGPVEASQSSIADGKYGQLSRMTYFYINTAELPSLGVEAQGFVRELVLNMEKYSAFANMVPLASLQYQENIRRTGLKR